MAVPGVKYDDGSANFATNCFPVRTLSRFSDEGGGAWLVAHKAEQRRRFKAVLCTQPKTYSQIREERKKVDRNEKGEIEHEPQQQTQEDEEEEEEEETKVLDGFFLMKHSCVEDPNDLCSVNVSGVGLSEVKEEDLVLFDNVAYVNAGENFLSLEGFKSFPIIRELEMPLNALRGVKLDMSDFPRLEMLDLSYNNLSKDDILSLGLLRNLRVLHLTGNNFRSLPPDMARPHVTEKNKRMHRFPSLEILMLDDNKLSDLTTFAALAGLRRLRHLSLEKNEIYSVPQLRLVDGKHITHEVDTKKGQRRPRSRASRPGSGKSKVKKVPKTPTSTPGGVLSITRESSDKKNLDVQNSQDTNTSQYNQNMVDALKKELNLGDLEATFDKLGGDSRPPPSPQGPPPPNSALGKTEAEIQQEVMVTARTAERVAESEELLSMDFSEIQLTARVDEEDEEKEEGDGGNKEDKNNSSSRRSREFTDSEFDANAKPPPPFPELKYLNLAHNKITEEDGLLAVAAWPLLTELIIHDNPLTTQRKGDPPLLKRFLQKRLGINIVRKKGSGIAKPHIEVTQKPSRKVYSKVPAIPKRNIDELLAIEAAPRAAILDSHPPRPSSYDLSKPLPPIPPSPDKRPQTEGSRPRDRPEGRNKEGTTTEAWGERNAAHESSNGDDGETFFMTQVDDVGGEDTASVTNGNQQQQSPKVTKKKKKVNEKYKGFELLLDEDEEEGEVPMPKDIQGNVRALQYALQHPLVFRDKEVHLDRPQKPFEPYQRSAPPSGPMRISRAEQIDTMLEKLKMRNTVVEAPLDDVLSSKKHLKEFPEANKLLNEIQRKYNSVRSDSMKDAKVAKSMVKSTMAGLNSNKGVK